MKKKTREQILKEKAELYQRVIRDLKPLSRKYGNEVLRLALQKWADHERRKNLLLSQKREIEKELTTL